MPNTQDLRETEFMALAPGVGVVPEQFRNKGYDKLPFGPGEGGFGVALDESQVEAEVDDPRMSSFLAGVAAGADPQAMAKELLGPDTSTKRRKRG